MTLEGVIRDRFPRVELRLRGRDGKRRTVEVIVDTAFDGELSLPIDVVTQLDVLRRSVRPIMTADGVLSEAEHVLTALEWNDEERVAEVIVSREGANALMGFELLEEHSLTVTFTRGGEVLIEPV